MPRQAGAVAEMSHRRTNGSGRTEKRTFWRDWSAAGRMWLDRSDGPVCGVQKVSEHKFANVTWTFGQTAQKPDALEDSYGRLQTAEDLRQSGQLAKAQSICESLLSEYPDYFGALFTLGLIFVERKQFPQALGVLVRAVMLNPRSWRALTALSAVYLELNANEMAALTLERAISIEPNNPNVLVTLGTIYSEEREYLLAQAAFREAYELDATLIDAAVGLGTCCSHLGQYAEAATIFESLLQKGTKSLGILYELSLLPPSYVSADIGAELSQVVREKDEDRNEFDNSLAFVRASILDRAGRYEAAWQILTTANSEMHKTVAAELREQIAFETDVLKRLKSRELAPFDNDIGTSARTLFILGPSRSGKTTLESLLGHLQGVKLGYENPSVENAIRRTFQSAGLLTTKLFELLPEHLDDRCRDFYLEELQRRAGAAKVFTNTHPGRIHDAARIAAAFPNTRFIFVKRNIEDNMLRIYMRKYQQANYYAYDLRSIQRYLIWYHEMIDFLAEKLPGVSRVIQYEEMVVDPLAALKTAAALCDVQVDAAKLPTIGDDRGCARPYQRLMHKML